MARISIQRLGEVDVRLHHHIGLGAKIQRALHHQFAGWILWVVTTEVLPPQQVFDVLLRRDPIGAYFDRIYIDRVDGEGRCAVRIQDGNGAVALGDQKRFHCPHLELDLHVLGKRLVEPIRQPGGHVDIVSCVAVRVGLNPDLVAKDVN